MLIDVMTFRLIAGVDEAVFLEADRRVQQEAVPNLAGFMRRTTARGDEGQWLVVTLWASAAAADAAEAALVGDDATAAFATFVDNVTLERRRYLTLD